LFVDQSSPSFFSPNVEGVAVERVFLRFSICRSFPEIYTIKVESCQKLCQNSDVIWPSQNLGGGLPNVVPTTHIITPASRHVVWEKFREDTPEKYVCNATECMPSKVISGSTKVVDFCTNRKRVFDFLLVINSNRCRKLILHRFVDTAAIKVENGRFVPACTHPHSTPSLGVTPFEFQD